MNIRQNDIIKEADDFRVNALIGEYVWVFDHLDARDASRQILYSTNISKYPFSTAFSDYRFIAKIVEEYRPFGEVQEFIPYRDMWIREKYGTKVERIAAYDGYGVFVTDNHRIWYEDLFKQYMFDDNTPCGIAI